MVVRTVLAGVRG